MVLKLYALPLSSCGRRVAVILHEKNVPYELVVPDMASNELKSTEWIVKQPFGQMPYIDDDGFILYESRAIARYIATKYASSGTPLGPADVSDVKAMALLDQAISVEASNFHPGAEGLEIERIYKPMYGQEGDPAVIQKSERTLTTKMDGFERLLARQKYMAGNNMTFVDLFFCPPGESLVQLGYDFLTNETKYPNVSRWWKEIHNRPAWQKVKDGIPASLVPLAA